MAVRAGAGHNRLGTLGGVQNIPGGVPVCAQHRDNAGLAARQPSQRYHIPLDPEAAK